MDMFYVFMYGNIQIVGWGYVVWFICGLFLFECLLMNVVKVCVDLCMVEIVVVVMLKLMFFMVDIS